MSRSFRAQWTNAGVFLVAAVALFVFNRGEGLVSSILFPAVALACAIVASPVFKRKSVSHQQAMALTGQRPTTGPKGTAMTDQLANDQANSPNVVIYHRPGCSFCARMKMALRSVADRAVWVDIWEDEEAAAFVRSVNNGNETVPTVVINGESLTNPSPALVLEALSPAG